MPKGRWLPAQPKYTRNILSMHLQNCFTVHDIASRELVGYAIHRPYQGIPGLEKMSIFQETSQFSHDLFCVLCTKRQNFLPISQIPHFSPQYIILGTRDDFRSCSHLSLVGDYAQALLNCIKEIMWVKSVCMDWLPSGLSEPTDPLRSSTDYKLAANLKRLWA